MEGGEVTSDQVEEVLAGSGHAVIRASDPEAVAEQAAERLGAELVFGVAELEAAIAERLAGVARRTSANEALDLLAGDRDASDQREVIADIAWLRTVVARIDVAQALVSATRTDMRDRVSDAIGIAVHPDTIRAAAAEVASARKAVEAARREVEAAEAEWRAGLGSFGPDDDLAGLDQFGASDDPEWEVAKSARPLVAAALVVVGAGVLAAAAYGPLGPVALAFPALAIIYAIFILFRTRDDAEDRDLASENLASVSALTAQAYGGSAEPTPPPAVHALQLQLDAALDRLRYSENSWRGLVGPDGDVESVEDLLRTRDPRVKVPDTELDQTPAVRTAQRHVRRLHAQWKLVWWALDRPVPSLETAAESIAELEAEGIDQISVLTHEGRASQAETTALVGDLSDGRTADQLMTEADYAPTSVVALDLDAAIDYDGLIDRASSLGGEARVIVVAPAHEG